MAYSSALLKAAGIALVAAGIGLGYWGHELSGSIGSQVTQAITGSAPDKVMTFYIAGAACLVSGLYLFFRK